MFIYYSKASICLSRYYGTQLRELSSSSAQLILNEFSTNSWTGGKPRGNIQLVNQYYYVRYHNHLLKCIKISSHESAVKAFASAKKLLYAYCKEQGLLRNEYRFTEDFDGSYLEVKVGKAVFTCDVDNLNLIEEHCWCFNARDQVVFTVNRSDRKTNYIYFHRVVMEPQSHQKVFHRDGNKLNNRRSNLSIE